MHRVNLENTGLFTDKFLNLTSFTVLTGINSSGKTTILKAIENQFDNVKHYKWTRLSIFTEHLEGEKGDILLFEQPDTMTQQFRYVGGHIEVFSESGEFLFSADTMQEAWEELSA